MRDLRQVEVASREELRAWLKANHHQASSVWLVTGKKKAGDRYIPYDAIVEEALCFGWIDSLPRKLDETRSMLLLSPRRPKSAWSKINRERAERLIADGRMQPPGLAKIEAAKADGSWDKLKPVENETAPPELDAALQTDEAATKAYQGLTAAKRRLAIRFVADAKAEATRTRRAAALLVALRRGLEPVDWRVGLAEVNEPDFIAALRGLARDPAARGLADDVAVLGDLVLTHDMIVEGVHFLPDDPPEDVAWKLVAVNLSDLAAKGAEPVGCLLGYALGTADWNARFVAGLRDVLQAYALPLLGGDTVRANGSRSFGLTALGRARHAPSRTGAQAGDALYVTGVIGRAGLGLKRLQAGQAGPEVEAYRRPRPRLQEGQALAPVVHAMMDVSDGLLLDGSRMAEASGLAVTIDLDAVPTTGEPLAAVIAGDDYELLFAAPEELALPVPATRIGSLHAGSGLTLMQGGKAVPLPPSLGWLHG